MDVPQVEPQHYESPDYESKKRFISYWHQIDEVRQLAPASVLEIGIGSGFVSRYLNEHGIDTTTLDFDERLSPDVVGSVLDTPFDNGAFELVACFEVLEHLPFDDFEQALNELHRISSSHVILSIPDATPTARVEIQFSDGPHLRRLYQRPQLRRQIHEFDGQHYWEIGKQSYSLDRILDIVNGKGFEVNKSYRIFEFPYHRFFVLHKKLPDR